MKRRVMTRKDTESDFSNQWNAKYYFPLNGDSYECVNGVLGELKNNVQWKDDSIFTGNKSAYFINGSGIRLAEGTHSGTRTGTGRKALACP